MDHQGHNQGLGGGGVGVDSLLEQIAFGIWYVGEFNGSLTIWRPLLFLFLLGLSNIIFYSIIYRRGSKFLFIAFIGEGTSAVIYLVIMLLFSLNWSKHYGILTVSLIAVYYLLPNNLEGSCRCSFLSVLISK